MELIQSGKEKPTLQQANLPPEILRQMHNQRAQVPKRKILAYLDAPVCATGFGTVSRNILEPLYNTGLYNIDLFGINYHGDPHGVPYRIWPTITNSDNDPYGRRKVCNMIPRMEFDILFFLQDTFILDFVPELLDYLNKQGRKYSSIVYFPIDGVPKKKWIENISHCDHIVSYTEFGKQEALKHKPDLDISVIPHGANVRDFFAINKEDILSFRKEYFGACADKFIWLNVNRNQQRKDIPRTIEAFYHFKKQVPESCLYLHMARIDQGWNLPELCANYGLSTTEDVLFPEHFGPNQGYPIGILNKIYNACDCTISTTLGEGFGLGWLESMATKTPVIVPKNTAMEEHITEEMGYLVNSGSNHSLWTVIPHDNEVRRPLVDVEDMVNRMLQVYNDQEESKRRAENAYKWIMTKMDWQGPIANQWISLFDKAYNAINSVVKPSSDKKENVIVSEVI